MREQIRGNCGLFVTEFEEKLTTDEDDYVYFAVWFHM